MAETVVIAGALAQKPRIGGHSWVLLQYLLGFKRLGWEPLFLDRLEPDMCVDAQGQNCPLDRSVNLRYFLNVMERFGPRDAFSLSYDGGARIVGMPRDEVLVRTRQSTLLLNVMGFLNDAEILAAAPRRVFLDIDPGFGQMWRELGLHDAFAGHGQFVTVGQNVGRPGCGVPDCGLDWIPSLPPVVLDLWPPCDDAANGWITSVASWRGTYGPVEYQGATYGLRVHEFRKFIELPRLSGQRLQLALAIHPDETRDIDLLGRNGWELVDPQGVAGDPWSYRRYIQSSRAELSIAKHMYVATHSGWFSDRSACYLASGRPVLAQDTGFDSALPTGVGLLPFSTVDEALGCIEELERDYARHCRAAREIAEQYLDSDKVLGQLVDALGAG